MKVLNAFSFNMIAEFPVTVEARQLSVDEIRQVLDSESIESCVGHADTAAVFGSVLGREVAANRATVSLEKGETVVIGQYRGPRLEEGTTSLPDGATIEWLLVAVL